MGSSNGSGGGVLDLGDAVVETRPVRYRGRAYTGFVWGSAPLRVRAWVGRAFAAAPKDAAGGISDPEALDAFNARLVCALVPDLPPEEAAQMPADLQQRLLRELGYLDERPAEGAHPLAPTAPTAPTESAPGA